jgi:nitrogen fixation protein FixH
MTERRTAIARSGERKLTGRTVFLCMLAFFGAITAVNVVMIRLATSTFGGVETASAYAAGLAFKQEEAAAGRQEALGWKVDGKIVGMGGGKAKLIVTAHTREGAVIPGWTARARLDHPADARLDRAIALTRTAPDEASGDIAASAGQWDLLIELSQEGGPAFRSRSRITLR